jgi:AbrB family looped-hinge helix DNA binding protein
VDAVVSIDAKGQIVLPKDIREKAKLRPNDKLAIVACEQNDQVCCIIMTKAENLGDSVKRALGPMLEGIAK